MASDYSSAQRKLLFFACLALAAYSQEAAATTVSFTTTSAISEFTNSQVIEITPVVASADELVSISGGSMTGIEFSSFTVAAVFESGPAETFFSYEFPGGGAGFSNYDLTSLPTESITSSASDPLTGILFQDAQGGTLTIPTGTVFTFDTTAPVGAPEPSGLVLLGLAIPAVPFLARRGRKRAS